MRRILVLTSDKTNAVQLRTILENLRIEFEIAIGEDTGRAVLSERFMNLIVLDASAIKGGSSWIFSFLVNRRLRAPVLVLGADRSALREVPAPIETMISFLPLPFDQARLESVLNTLLAWTPEKSLGADVSGRIPLASATNYIDD